MQEDFLTRIRSSYNQFTKAEKRVADFILQNPNEVLFMSISDLAETCRVGDTSVFRFCKTMNLKGYQDFKMTLSLSMRGSDKEAEESHEAVSLEDNLKDLADKVLNETISSIQESYSLLELSQVSLAMDALSKARRILFFGVGASMLTAMKAMNKFHRIEPKVYCSEMVREGRCSRDFLVFRSNTGYCGDCKAREGQWSNGHFGYTIPEVGAHRIYRYSLALRCKCRFSAKRFDFRGNQPAFPCGHHVYGVLQKAF